MSEKADRWPTGGPEFVSSNKTFHGDVDGAPIKDFMEDPANQRRFPRDMRTMYELLDTLDEAALVAQRRLTVPFIRSVLKE